jgi:hypothetical protein
LIFGQGETKGRAATGLAVRANLATVATYNPLYRGQAYA